MSESICSSENSKRQGRAQKNTLWNKPWCQLWNLSRLGIVTWVNLYQKISLDFFNDEILTVELSPPLLRHTFWHNCPKSCKCIVPICCWIDFPFIPSNCPKRQYKYLNQCGNILDCSTVYNVLCLLRKPQYNSSQFYRSVLMHDILFGAK